MAATTATYLAIEDMNGPLGYWGPVAQADTAEMLTPSEKAALLRLRERIQRADTVGLIEVLGGLLATPTTVAARA